MIQKIEIPINVVYVFDENELQIHEISDITHLEEKYDVDLQQITDEYEYKLEAEETYLDVDEDDSDYPSENAIEILQGVIDNNYNFIIDSINREMKLSELTVSDVIKIFTTIKDIYGNVIDGKLIANIDSYNISESKLIFNIDTNGCYDDIVNSKLYTSFSNIIEPVDISTYIKESDMRVYVKWIE